MAYVVRHPLRNQIYRLTPDGNVQVDDLNNGVSGIFTRGGTPVAGDLRFADLHLLDWVGGRALLEARHREDVDATEWRQFRI